MEFKLNWKEDASSFFDPDNLIQSVYNPHYIFYTKIREKLLFRKYFKEVSDRFQLKLGGHVQNLLTRPEFNPTECIRLMRRPPLLLDRFGQTLAQLPISEKEALELECRVQLVSDVK